MSPAVVFESRGNELHLLYSPQDDDQWVQAKFARNEALVIKGTFRLTAANLVSPDAGDEDEEQDEFQLRFRVATMHGQYYKFDPDVVQVDCPVLLDKNANPTWKWFSSERATSVIGVIADLKPKRIVIGGKAADAIPIPDYEKLVAQFPTGLELKRYTLARVSSVVRDYMETEVDGEKLFQKYVNKRVNRKTVNFRTAFSLQDIRKYQFLLEKLTQLLSKEDTYPEAFWQQQILQIILLLNPKYIQALQNVQVPGENGVRRFIDVLLIDASGNVDVIEIKKPFDKSIVTTTVYRDNHIPLRELSGSVMQVEKYIHRLNRWGETGEKHLTTKYAHQLPPNFEIKITNPSGIIIVGRDQNLNSAQRRDFEYVRRKYKSIVDIVTYDDLRRRLGYVVMQLAPAKKSAARKGRAAANMSGSA
jgi:hypothetical protein